MKLENRKLIAAYLEYAKTYYASDLPPQAYPDATNREAGAAACGRGRTRTGGRRGERGVAVACCVTLKARSSHGLFRGTIAEKDPRVFGPQHRRREGRQGLDRQANERHAVSAKSQRVSGGVSSQAAHLDAPSRAATLGLRFPATTPFPHRVRRIRWVSRQSGFGPVQTN